MNVNNNGVLNISGNLTQTGQAVSNVVLDGGQINVGGSVLLNSGTITNITTLSIETINSGIFDVANAFNSGNNSLIEISGDGSGNLSSGTLTFGNNARLNLNSNGKFNVETNMNIPKGTVTTVFLAGGELKITGTLDVATGSGNNLATLNISGSGISTSRVITNNLNLNNNSKINIEPNGVLIVDGPTIFAANNTNITNRGFYRTNILDIRGQGTLDNLGNGITVIDEDLIIRGNAGLIVSGNSEVEIGGNIDFDGNNGILDIELEGSVRVCGDGILPDENGPNVEVDRPTATYERGNCRILPVDYLYIEFEYSKVSNSALLSWATAKEWENSRFEIERSIGDIRNFIKIGEVSGMGWKDSITEYEYVDANLPLSGGNIYYRLKQVDMNGEFSLSKVLSVKMPSVQFTQGVWRAYPNPTDGHQFRIGLLDISQYSEEKISFRIIQPNHVMEAVTVDSEAEMNEYLNQILPTISSGVFVVEIQWGQRIEHIKVLKQK
jgi:hypothetical protein